MDTLVSRYLHAQGTAHVVPKGDVSAGGVPVLVCIYAGFRRFRTRRFRLVGSFVVPVFRRGGTVASGSGVSCGGYAAGLFVLHFARCLALRPLVQGTHTHLSAKVRNNTRTPTSLNPREQLPINREEIISDANDV